MNENEEAPSTSKSKKKSRLERAADEREIRRKVQDKVYKLSPRVGARAECWKKFEDVVEAATSKSVGWVHCTKCDEYLPFSGTSGLNRNECPVQAGELIRATPAAKDLICDALAEFVGVDLRALEVVHGTGFQALAQVLVLIGAQYGAVDVRDLLCDPATIRRRVHEVAEAEREEVYRKVKAAIAAGELSCTIDSWTEDSKKVVLVACNCTYVITTAEGKWALETKILFTEPYPKGRAKSSENLRDFIFQNFLKRGLVTEDQRHKMNAWFVTDGEQALVNALEDWVRREYCAAHGFNITFTHVINVSPKEFASLPDVALSIIADVTTVCNVLRKIRGTVKGKKYLAASKLVLPKYFTNINMTSFLAKNFQQVRDVLQKAEKLAELEILRKMHLGDVHTLATYLEQLETAVGRVGTVPGSALPAVDALCQDKDDDTPLMGALRANLRECSGEARSILRVNQLRDSCKELVTYMKSSGQMSELSFSLKQCMEVRWNSVQTMLLSVQKVYDELVAFFERKNAGVTEANRFTYMDAIDKQLLDEVIEVLQPLKKQTERVQAKDIVTAPMPLISKYTLLEQYKAKESDSDVTRHLKARLSRELVNVVEVTDTHKVAAFLDPLYRRLLMIPAERERIHEVVRNLISGDGEADELLHDDDDLQPPASKKSKEDEYDMWKDSDTAVEDEVHAYLAEPIGQDYDNDPLDWWRRHSARFPKLAKLARQYLVVSATSAESERTFSDAGWILNVRRKALHPEVVGDLLCIHLNCRKNLKERLESLRRRKRPKSS